MLPGLMLATLLPPPPPLSQADRKVPEASARGIARTAIFQLWFRMAGNLPWLLHEGRAKASSPHESRNEAAGKLDLVAQHEHRGPENGAGKLGGALGRREPGIDRVSGGDLALERCHARPVVIAERDRGERVDAALNERMGDSFGSRDHEKQADATRRELAQCDISAVRITYPIQPRDDVESALASHLDRARCWPTLIAQDRNHVGGIEDGVARRAQIAGGRKPAVAPGQVGIQREQGAR